MRKDRTPDGSQTPAAPVEAVAETTTELAADTAEAAEADETDAPMNRAERRAKGKKGAQQTTYGGKQKVTHKGGQAHSPRLWANRRAG